VSTTFGRQQFCDIFADFFETTNFDDKNYAERLNEFAFDVNGVPVEQSLAEVITELIDGGVFHYFLF
jgi:hypothetical protein